MKTSRFLRRNKHKPILLVVAVMMIAVGIGFDRIAERNVIIDTPTQRIVSNIQSALKYTEPLEDKWLEGVDLEEVKTDKQLHDYKLWEEIGISMYMYEDGVGTLWCNDKVALDLKKLTDGQSLDTLFNAQGNYMLVFRSENKDTKREVLIALELMNGDELNAQIFPNKQIKLHKTEVVNPKRYHRVECNGAVFWCSNGYEMLPSLITNVIGWCGMLMLLLLLVSLLLDNTNRGNVIAMVFLSLFLLLLIRMVMMVLPYDFLTGRVGQANFEGWEMYAFSPMNLMFNGAFLLLFSFYVYAIKHKQRRAIELSGVWTQRALYAAVLGGRTITVLYVNLAVVVNVYDEEMLLRLINNDYSLNTVSLLIYAAFTLLFIAIYFQYNLLLIPRNKKFLTCEFIIALVLMTGFILVFWTQLHNTWIVLPLFLVGFRLLNLLDVKYPPQTLFILCAVMFSLYVAVVDVTERFESSAGTMTEYSNEYVGGFNKSDAADFKGNLVELVNENYQVKHNVEIMSPKWRGDTTVFVDKTDYDVLSRRGEAGVLNSSNNSMFFTVMSQMSVLFFLIMIVAIPVLWILGVRNVLKWPIGKRSLVQKIQLLVLTVIIVSFVSSLLIEVANARRSEVRVRSVIVVGIIRVIQNNIHNYSTHKESNTAPMLKEWFEWHGGKLITSNLGVFDKSGSKISASPDQQFSQYMNFNAYNKLNFHNVALYGYEDGDDYQIFFPAYYNDEVLGYVNVAISNIRDIVDSRPYVYEMLSLLFIALFVLVCISWLIYRMIAVPIGVFQRALSKTNELTPIPYNKVIAGNAEMRALANQYNKMVQYLEEYAQVTANAQRESLWHDVAREMAHEIKNPLTPMKLKIQMLQHYKIRNGYIPEDKIDETLQLLLEQINVIDEVVNDFRNVAGMNIGNVEVINLSGLLSNVISLYGNYNGREVEVAFKVEGKEHGAVVDDAWVMADSVQLIRVFSNLLKNAAQATEDTVLPKIDIDLKISKMGETAHVVIADNGVGVPSEIAPRIFERSFTTKLKGLGIGLAVASKIVENLNGDISFYNNDKGGATFVVRLPLVKSK